MSSHYIIISKHMEVFTKLEVKYSREVVHVCQQVLQEPSITGKLYIHIIQVQKPTQLTALQGDGRPPHTQTKVCSGSASRHHHRCSKYARNSAMVSCSESMEAITDENCTFTTMVATVGRGVLRH